MAGPAFENNKSCVKRYGQTNKECLVARKPLKYITPLHCCSLDPATSPCFHYKLVSIPKLYCSNYKYRFIK